MSIGHELADLLTLLAIVCVPLAVGGVCIPVGRAIADRIRGAGRAGANDDASWRALGALERRLAILERTVVAQADAMALLASHQRQHVPPSTIGPGVAPRVVTPH